jgi:hypothetical protein
MTGHKPTWFAVGDELMWPLVGMGQATARDAVLPVALKPIPELAFCHYAGCLVAGGDANRRGYHFAAMSLIRQSVEALTVAEIGLQESRFATPLLGAWNEGNKTHGELRAALERDIWPHYGSGLWDEPWSDFYRNLGKAVQSYAHYTHQLQGWQLVTLQSDGNLERTVTFGIGTYDPLLATRITFFQMLLTWMLGRILLTHGRNADVLARRGEITRLGRALGASKLLFKGGEWWAQLTPDMVFKPGYDWMDKD